MKSKRCKSCQKDKPTSEFYALPKMSDGLCAECKMCVRKRVREREKRLKATDPEWVERELARHRLKTRRYVSDGRAKKITLEKKRLSIAKYDEKHPHKKKARHIVSNAIRDGKIQRLPCTICGGVAEAHHDDYDKPLDVIWLCSKHHAERHIQLRQQQRRLRAIAS